MGRYLTLTASKSSVFSFLVIHGVIWSISLTISTFLPATLSGLARTAATASFPALAEDNKLAVKSLTLLERKLREKRGLHPLFHHRSHRMDGQHGVCVCPKEQVLFTIQKRPRFPSAPYDAYDESDDTEENAKSGFLKGVGR